jgi:formylglycine-generating enzyme required for sulfatase activity
MACILACSKKTKPAGADDPGRTPVMSQGMKLIPGGSFQMGSNAYGDEQPVHTVTVASFYMDSTEVAPAGYRALMGAGPAYFAGNLKRHNKMVTWFDAVLYCNKRSKTDGKDTCYRYTGKTMNRKQCIQLTGLSCDFGKQGYRLPTEAEWEYACRGGSTTDYYWGKDYNPYPETEDDSIEMDDNAIWCRNVYGKNSRSLRPETQSVSTTLPNAFGLYNMSGNMWEWCNDWYDAAYYSTSPALNPTGPATGTCRVLRGGSWSNNAYCLRSAHRSYSSPDNRGPQSWVWSQPRTICRAFIFNATAFWGEWRTRKNTQAVSRDLLCPFRPVIAAEMPRP